MKNLADIARKYHANEKVDGNNDFQRRARILQSIWREENEFPIGRKADGSLSGSRIAIQWAEETLNNFLTENIKDVVRNEVFSDKGKGKFYKKQRIVANLLSSQPLCFNLFGELQRDTALASHMIRTLTEGAFSKVENVEFEFSPGRGDTQYTGDRSAFDVFLVCRDGNNNPGFIGIEVKYHEDLTQADDEERFKEHYGRYLEISRSMNCFIDSESELFKTPPLQQIWRDHLLAGSMEQTGEFGKGLFVFLYPKENEACEDAVQKYGSCLESCESFKSWTLEQVCEALTSYSDDAWIESFVDRYLNFEKLEQIEQS